MNWLERWDQWIDAHGWVVPVVLAAAVAAVFGGTLRYDFVYDDRWFILKNPALAHVFPLSRFFLDGSTSALPASGINGDVYRPLSSLSFAINAALSGLSTPWFRAVNIFLHAANGLLIFAMLKKAAPASAALLAALLFLVHPVQVESVVWISQRSILLCAFGVLGSLWAWDNAEFDDETRWIPISLGFFLIALFSKETAIGLPLLLALRLNGREDPRLRALATYFAMAAGYLILRGRVLGGLSQHVQMAGSTADGLRGLAHNIRSIVWPNALNVSYRWPDGAPLRSLDFWAGLGLFAFFSGGAVAMWRSRRRMALGCVIFLLFWAPHSGLVPVVTFAADRFLYLPLAGIAFLFCSVVIEKPRLTPFLAVFLLAWGAASVERTADWKNDVTLWGSSLRVNDKNPFALASYAAALQEKGRLSEAEDYYKLSLQNGPNVGLAGAVLSTLADLCDRRGDMAAAAHWREKLSGIPK